ncbi:hypothetical protein C2845_PM03G25160 [Panicum miliaceum]|uniref:Peptidase A1 domain-containing protein n=1 Tax=Panicum miliaceum TaxID=4540 RepID=A0A3L6TCJ9_PANMI|nr:hypothetical protein C2845_PM03G25160 [Panicum miliaceum]
MASTTASITRILPLLLLLLLTVPSSSSYIKFDLHGNVYPVGHIYVTIKIGEPAKEYNLDVDTGSILTWLQCHDPNCRGDCKKWRQPHPYYELTPGKVLPRNDPLCRELHPVPGEQKCRYRIAYAHGNSKGLLIRDKLTLPSRNAQQSIAFGCGYDQPGVPAPVDGILAHGRGPSVTLISQLKRERAITKDLITHYITMQDRIVIYDNEGSQIGWAHHSC